MSWRSERMPSKNMTSCSLKKTTGSMRGPAPLGVQLPRPLADEAQVELRLEVAVEVVRRDEVLERDGDRLIEAAGLGRAEHEGSPGRVVELGNAAQFTPIRMDRNA